MSLVTFEMRHNYKTSPNWSKNKNKVIASWNRRPQSKVRFWPSCVRGLSVPTLRYLQLCLLFCMMSSSSGWLTSCSTGAAGPLGLTSAHQTRTIRKSCVLHLIWPARAQHWSEEHPELNGWIWLDVAAQLWAAH